MCFLCFLNNIRNDSLFPYELCCITSDRTLEYSMLKITTFYDYTKDYDYIQKEEYD